jgi:CHAT domain-containing protein/tetratricopeptide (TPR) repeat protein
VLTKQALVGVLCLLSAFACGRDRRGGEAVNVDARERAIRALISEGRYADALMSAEALVASLPAGWDHLTESSALAFDALVEVRWRMGSLSLDTLPIAQRLVEWHRAHTDDRRTAASLRGLGQILLLAGRANDAVAAFEASLKSEPQPAAPSGPWVADGLDGLAAAFIELTQYERAEQALRRALSARAANSDPRPLARTLELQSLVMMRTGRYREARKPLEAAVAIRRAQPDHPDMAATRALEGDLLWFEGRPAPARDAYHDCLSIAEARLGPNYPGVAHCSRRLGLMLVSLGDISEALALFERAARIAEASLGSAHPLFAGYLNDLAEAHRTVMNFRQARELYERALLLKERQLGPDHDSVATTVYNLALVSSDLGDLSEARRHFTRAMAIWQARLGADHPFVALAKASLAQTLLKHGQDTEAAALQREALAMRERSLGPFHRDTADALADLAGTLLVLGRTSEAVRFSERALAIWQQDAGADAPGFAAVLALRASVLAVSGDIPAARNHYRRALAITERVFGSDHPNTAELQVKLASLSAGAGERTLALDQALAAEASARRFLQQTLRYLPEREGISYAARRPSGLNLALTLTAQSSSARIGDVDRVYEAVIQNRALVFDEIAARQQAAATAPLGDGAALWTAWVSARQRVANLSVRTDQRASASQLSVLQQARRDAERAERALAAESSIFSAEQRRDTVTLTDIRHALPPRAALISFVRYDRPRNNDAAITGSRGVLTLYAAFVLDSTASEPVLISLGPATAIEADIAEWRRLVARGVPRSRSATIAERDIRAVGERLRRRLWNPLEPHLGAADRVFIVPDGALHLVTFAALPAGTSEYLIDRGPLIHYLTSERDLVNRLRRQATQARGLLALGGATFDVPGVVPVSTSTNRTADVVVRSGCESFEALKFAALPGTLAEVEDVALRWQQVQPVSRQPVNLLMGTGATERVFKRRAPGNRVLHLATHGFFLSGDCAAAPRSTRAVGGVAGGAVGASLESPLLQTGLALAGANRRAEAGPDEEDGILTAEEVAAMNLDSVEWAVLSACDTGLGEIRSGEGVFGLRRAFQIAGARTVIMSLWSVEDLATRRWMTALYDGRLRMKLGTAESVREASLTVLRDRRARGLSTHPFFWAAFIAAGDWT